MAVLNDFEANGYGVTAVSEENLISLNEVPAKPRARPALRLGCALECCTGFYTFDQYHSRPYTSLATIKIQPYTVCGRHGYDDRVLMGAQAQRHSACGGTGTVP